MLPEIEIAIKSSQPAKIDSLTGLSVESPAMTIQHFGLQIECARSGHQFCSTLLAIQASRESAVEVIRGNSRKVPCSNFSCLEYQHRLCLWPSAWSLQRSIRCLFLALDGYPSNRSSGLAKLYTAVGIGTAAHAPSNTSVVYKLWLGGCSRQAYV